MFKPTVIAISVSLCGVTASLAGSHTPIEFEAVYSRAIEDATRLGEKPENRCWARYCALSMTAVLPHGVIYVAKITPVNGAQLREVCLSLSTEPSERLCSMSDGEVFSERYSNNGWHTVRMISEHYDSIDSP